jgi:hypothetical protein
MIFMEHLKKGKFYWLLIEQDLLGTWCVKKIYGQLPNKSVGSELIPCNNQHEAWLLLCDLEISKRQHGYTYSNSASAEYYALTPQLIEDIEEI